MNEKNNNIVIISLTVIVLLSIFEVYHCPIKTVIGLSCPACGITRAIISAVNFDFLSAFKHHLFWPIIPLSFLIYLFNKFKIIIINKKTLMINIYIICSLNTIYYFYRLFSNSNIVYFDFTESLIYKLINLL